MPRETLTSSAPPGTTSGGLPAGSESQRRRDITALAADPRHQEGQAAAPSRGRPRARPAPWHPPPARWSPGACAQPAARRATRSASGSAGAPEAGVSRHLEGLQLRRRRGSRSGTAGRRSDRRGRAAGAMASAPRYGLAVMASAPSASYRARACCSEVEPMSPRLASAMNGTSSGHGGTHPLERREAGAPEGLEEGQVHLDGGRALDGCLEDEAGESLDPDRHPPDSRPGVPAGPGQCPRTERFRCGDARRRADRDTTGPSAPQLTERCWPADWLPGPCRQDSGRRAACVRWSAGMNQAGAESAVHGAVLGDRLVAREGDPRRRGPAS